MEAYDALLTEMQKMATDAYQDDRRLNDQLWRQDYVFPLGEVHERIHLHVQAVLEEVRDRIVTMAEHELEMPLATACDHLRSLAFAVAANEIDMYIQGLFSCEPIEIRVPEEAASIPEEVISILETVEKMRFHPHFVYDASSGVVVGIYPGKEKVPAEETPKTTSGHTRWVISEKDQETLAHMRDFGVNLQAKRLEVGYKIKSLAKWVKIHPNTLREIESGMMSRIGGTELRQGHWLVQRLAEYLNVTAETLWPWSDDKEKDQAW